RKEKERAAKARGEERASEGSAHATGGNEGRSGEKGGRREDNTSQPGGARGNNGTGGSGKQSGQHATRHEHGGRAAQSGGAG
ncbi:transferase, partial [Mycobacterium tuberculosis]